MSQNISHAVMAQRREAHDSLDDFPTPPWATRAFLRHVVMPLPFIGDDLPRLSAWEPACNRGHMAKPLAEFFSRVYTSDVHDYSEQSVGFCQDRVADFLWPDAESPAIKAQGVDWIITNPPFRLAEQFIQRARSIAKVGVAVIVRTAFLEGVGRYHGLFQASPPAVIAQFSERVVMHKGRLAPEGSTATAYCWITWLRDQQDDTRFIWIPPCRRQLERTGDYETVEAAA